MVMDVKWKWKCYGLQGNITGNGNGIGNAIEKLKRDGIGTRDGKIAVKDLNGKIGK